MPSTSSSSNGSGVVVPPDVSAQFSELVALIMGSESMNTEERQYWINVLPMMHPDQRKNLEDILTNERNQLSDIDAKYKKELAQIGEEEFVRSMQAKRSQKRSDRAKAQKGELEQEEQYAKDVLKKIEEQ